MVWDKGIGESTSKSQVTPHGPWNVLWGFRSSFRYSSVRLSGPYFESSSYEVCIRARLLSVAE